MEIFYQPHKSRKKEADFVDYVIGRFGITNIIKKSYLIPDMPGDVNITSILQALDEFKTSGKRWSKLVNELKKLPPTIKVFTKAPEISCDIVIVDNNQPRFIEYHEKQHYRFSDDRRKHIYDILGNRVIIPRFVQRFLRDVWRIQNLNPLLIVWDDKFQKDGLSQSIFENSGTFEHSLEEKNIFSKFILHR